MFIPKHRRKRVGDYVRESDWPQVRDPRIYSANIYIILNLEGTLQSKPLSHAPSVQAGGGVCFYFLFSNETRFVLLFMSHTRKPMRKFKN